jgi:hypothetical protein
MAQTISESSIPAQHKMTEFEAGMHYLKDPMGADVEALEELPAAAKCVGDVNMPQVGDPRKPAKQVISTMRQNSMISLNHVDHAAG